MKPVPTLATNATFELEGGTRENDLPAEVTTDTGDQRCIRTTWELTGPEYEAVTNGARVYLIVWGSEHPPVALGVEGVDPG